MSKKTCVVDLHVQDHQRPAYDVYVGRGVRYTEFKRDSIWHNPFYARSRSTEEIQFVISKYETHIRRKIADYPVKFKLDELKGQKLGCWCLNTESFLPPYRCHGQILLKLVFEKWGEL
jgi:hypothetical protein